MQNDKIEKARKLWSESLDKDIFQAVDNLDNYDSEIRHIILEEAERRKKDLPLKEKQLREDKISNYKTLDNWIFFLYLYAFISIFLALLNWLYLINVIACIALAKGMVRRNKLAGVLVFLLCILTAVFTTFEYKEEAFIVIQISLFLCYFLGYRAMIGIYRYHDFQKKKVVSEES